MKESEGSTKVEGEKKEVGNIELKKENVEADTGKKQCQCWYLLYIHLASYLYLSQFITNLLKIIQKHIKRSIISGEKDKLREKGVTDWYEFRGIETSIVIEGQDCRHLAIFELFSDFSQILLSFSQN